MEYSLDSIQDNCYENTTVLINKLDIRDEATLNAVEETLTAANAASIELENDFNNVDFEYYKSLHKRLFEDLYEWSGQVRAINISKKGTNFCEHSEIEEYGRKCFDRLKQEKYLANLPFSQFIDELTDLYCSLNALHPFREGNGRCQRLFLTLLIKNVGYDINFASLDTDLLMIATIKAVTGDIFLLKDILRDNIFVKNENEDETSQE